MNYLLSDQPPKEIVQPLLKSHPQGNRLWLLTRLLKGGWRFNRGKNSRKAVIGTLIAGRLIGVDI